MSTAVVRHSLESTRGWLDTQTRASKATPGPSAGYAMPDEVTESAAPAMAKISAIVFDKLAASFDVPGGVAGVAGVGGGVITSDVTVAVAPGIAVPIRVARLSFTSVVMSAEVIPSGTVISVTTSTVPTGVVIVGAVTPATPADVIVVANASASATLVFTALASLLLAVIITTSNVA